MRQRGRRRRARQRRRSGQLARQRSALGKAWLTSVADAGSLRFRCPAQCSYQSLRVMFPSHQQHSKLMSIQLAPHFNCRAEAEAAEAARAASEAALRRRQSEKALALPAEPPAGEAGGACWLWSGGRLPACGAVVAAWCVCGLLPEVLPCMGGGCLVGICWRGEISNRPIRRACVCCPVPQARPAAA